MTTKTTNTTSTISTSTVAAKSKLVKGTKKQQAPRPCVPLFIQ